MSDAEKDACVLATSGWPATPCPTYCVEKAAHHHHDEQGRIWTNPGETCGTQRTSVFYEDHERDMQNPEYREAFKRATRILPPGS